ncbi:glycosyltransferase family 2 protein [Halomonas sp. TBZ9]|uniref:Glycosyltransferase family 2 protein n=1 Tax=Vreelandella azerica TaxID=2732867 RepID=A0A7Y3TX75_9GAMM|nr:glycosyltransferase family 2 protein [Halomonas azerica]
MWAANNLLSRGFKNKAIKFLDDNLPKELAYTKNIILANCELEKGNEKGWLDYFNKYLEYFNISKLLLKDDREEGMISRFYTEGRFEDIDAELVTVIMPVWNSQDTVYYAAKSILNQTWRNIELILVDDCSTDKTAGFLKK